MSPEMLQQNGHNFSLDFYSLGCLLYELTTGLPPFYSENRQQMYKSIVNEEVFFPDFLSTEIKDFMSKLLEKDPSKRLGSKSGA